VDDTPFANDGADTSLRKTVSLLNKIETKTGVSGTITTVPRSGATSKSVRQGLLGSGTDKIFEENPARKYLLVQNLSPSFDIYLGIGYAPSNPTPLHIGPLNASISGNSGNGILLPKKGGGIIFEGSYIPTAAIYLNAEVNLTSTPYAMWIAIEA
jgi:hypothetical protein